LLKNILVGKKSSLDSNAELIENEKFKLGILTLSNFKGTVLGKGVVFFKTLGGQFCRCFNENTKKYFLKEHAKRHFSKSRGGFFGKGYNIIEK